MRDRFRRRGNGMPSIPGIAPVLEVARGRSRPAAVQVVRSTLAATIAYLVALLLSDNARPLLAPLTAILVVQVTLYATLTAGIRRVVAVVAGVLLALGFVTLVGFSWWSLGLLILASLTAGHVLRVHQFVPEVAISGMLVLGLGSAQETGLDRVVETLIGAAVGMLMNIVVAPPVFVAPASGAIEGVATRMGRLLRRVGSELWEGATVHQTTSWLQEARDIDREILRVEDELSRAEESLRLNPRALRSLHAGMVLRSGLETLEHCAVTTRGLCRALTDLSREHGREPSLYGEETASSSRELLNRLSDAVASFGRMLAAEISVGADRAEADLGQALAQARTLRAQIADLLYAETDRDPETWELHGALLAHVDRLVDELDLRKRAEQRLAAYDVSRAPVRHATRTLVDDMLANLRAIRSRAFRRP